MFSAYFGQNSRGYAYPRCWMANGSVQWSRRDELQSRMSDYAGSLLCTENQSMGWWK